MENARIERSLSSGRLLGNVTSSQTTRRLTVMGLCLLLLGTGCSIRRIVYNETITSDQIQFIQAGLTTMPDVFERLGAPDEIAETESGVVAHYDWSDTKSAAVDFGTLGKLFLPYSPTMTLSKIGIAPERFIVVFDPQWTVRAYGFARWPKDDPVIWFWPF